MHGTQYTTGHFQDMSQIQFFQGLSWHGFRFLNFENLSWVFQEVEPWTNYHHNASFLCSKTLWWRVHEQGLLRLPVYQVFEGSVNNNFQGIAHLYRYKRILLEALLDFPDILSTFQLRVYIYPIYWPPRLDTYMTLSLFLRHEKEKMISHCLFKELIIDKIPTFIYLFTILYVALALK